MMKRVASFAVAGVLAVTLVACEGSNYGQKQTGGALIGGAVGGLLGSQVGGGSGRLAATALGAVAGLFLGSEIGKSLDKADRLYAQRTAHTALENNPVGRTSSWSNPDSGHSGSVTPTRTVYADSGEPCRDYQTTVTIDGRTETATGRACRQADGTWRIAN